MKRKLRKGKKKIARHGRKASNKSKASKVKKIKSWLKSGKKKKKR